ncbi:MAG: GNAT family N-acetyltransferase [Erysipelotrichaceae bacterium]|nr:GNAT family N-acetyltransferase [Erysipelotrichaceae bacterium]
MKGLNAPVINTDRLFIRLVDINDYQAYFNFCSKAEVCQFLSFNPYSNVNQAKIAINNMIRAYLADSDVNFSIVLKKTNDVIGSISLSFKNDNSGEVGYLLDSTYWNNKIMDEALKAIIEISFNYYQLNYLCASFISENVASEKLLLNNGFKIIKVEPTLFKKNNKVYNLVYCIKEK